MANKILFKTSTSNDSTKLIPASGSSTIAKVPGTVYFTKDGKIIYDLDSNTRLVMSDSVSHAVSADTANKAINDKNGKDITTYMASAAWDSTTPTTLNLRNSLGTNIFSVKLAEKFLPLVAGPNNQVTGDLYLSVGNEDRFLNFKYTGTGYDWRIGYLGSGSGNENYLVIQSDGSDGVTWTNALRFGLTDLNATFGGSILPSTTGTKDLGTSSLRWKGIYGQTLNLSGNATIGDATSDSHIIKGTVTQTGNFLPGTNATYNLGSDNAKWKILYIGNGDDATSTTTGVIRAAGGIAATGSGYFGGNLTAVNVNGKALSLTETATAGNGIYLYRNSGSDEALRINVDANNGIITNTNETLQSILNLVLEYKDTANSGAGAGSKTVTFKATSSGSEITATKFIGNLTGTASKATADANNRNIEQTYLKSVTLENEYKMYRTTGNGTKTLVGSIAPLDTDNLIPLKYLPATALERIYVVEDEDARLALTILEVQNGDVVRVNSTNLMYLVYDDTKLGTEDAFKVFVAGSAANADNARYAESAGKATNDSNGNKIDESYITYPFVLNADKTKVTLANGVGDETLLDYNYYPTAMTWIAGSSAGPTATISMAGTTDIEVGAIPSASGSASGIVTTGTQTFGGAKTFNNNVTVQKILSAGSGNNATSTTTGDLRINGGAGITKDVWVGGNLYLAGNNADKYLVFEHTGSDKYDWRIGYLGTGEGDANYLTFQSKGESTSYTNVIKLGATTHDATFAADIFPDVTEANDMGSSTLRWNNLYAKVGNFSSDVTIGGAATIGGDVLPSADATYDLGSSAKKWQLLYINKTAYIGNGDDATSATTGALQVTGGAAVSKNMYVGANLTVKGTTTLGDAESDTVSIVGDTTFSNDVVINKTLNVKGAVTLGDAEGDTISIVGDTSFTNDVTIGKTLTVTGAVTTKGTVTLGDAEGDTVTVNGDTTFKNDVSITKTLTVGQQVKIGNGADISTEPCDLEVIGGVDVGKNLRVTGGTANTATIEFKQEARVVYDSTKKAFNFVFD